MVSYWDLKNKDPGMPKFAKERVKAIFNSFENLVEKYTRESYKNIKTLNESIQTKTDQRIDFMMNLYREILKHASSKLFELEKERDRRTE